jgi:hypothetical protein
MVPGASISDAGAVGGVRRHFNSDKTRVVQFGRAERPASPSSRSTPLGSDRVVAPYDQFRVASRSCASSRPADPAAASPRPGLSLQNHPAHSRKGIGESGFCKPPTEASGGSDATGLDLETRNTL